MSRVARAHPAWFLAIPMALMAFVAFLPSLGNGFVDRDDLENFLENDDYRGLGRDQVRWAFTTFHHGVYQPLSWLIFEAQYAAWGLDPRGYHLTSLLLHAANAVVLYVLTVTLLRFGQPDLERRRPWALDLGPGLAVTAFAVHPLRTEVVAWASCQPYLPCALFSMLSVLAYLRSHTGRSVRVGWWIGSFLVFAAALLTKAVAVSLPAVLLILDLYPLRRLGGEAGRRGGPSSWGVWLEKLAFLGLSLPFMGAAIRAKEAGDVIVLSGPDGLASRIAQACYGACFYLVKTVYPIGITAYYPRPERMDWTQSLFLACIVAVAGVSAACLLLCTRWPGLFAAWASYLAILSPNAGLVRVGQEIAADRYSYIAMMGLVVLLAAGLSLLIAAGRRPRLVASCLTVAGLSLILGLTLLSWRQCQIWRDTVTLWSDIWAHDTSGAPDVPTDMGRVLINHGRYTEAIPHLAKAIRIDPGFAPAYLNMGRALTEQGRLDEAIVYLTEAVQLDPESAWSHANLGAALGRKGRFDEAMTSSAEAIRLKPGFFEAHTNLGMCLAVQGKLDEAIAQFAEAVRIRPDYVPARRGLAAALQARERRDVTH
jgi:tetratricopeptide (TPR) repeat protein